MKKWKDNIHFVLVEPRESGNIGGAARALKNMDFKHLCLVNPVSFVTDDAIAFAHNATDVLKSSRVVNSVKEALRDKQYVIGTSRRRGRRRGVFLPIEEASRRLYSISQTNCVAIMFGREDRGLFNDEVEKCGFVVTIPANKEHPSLNLSHAVMILAYELSKAAFNKENTSGNQGSEQSFLYASPPRLARQEELDILYDRLENALKIIKYIPQDNAFLNKKIMENLKHCLGRTGLSHWELNMFHRICACIEKKCME